MGTFDWDDSYDLKIEAMNLEHKGLLRLMAKLKEESEAGVTKAELTRTLHELLRATVQHFADEERYMASIAFRDLRTHALIHEQLVEKLRGHARTYEAGRDPALPPAFFSFLKLWLTSHIVGIDMRYATHARGRPAA